MDENVPHSPAEPRRVDLLVLAVVNIMLLATILTAILALCHVFAPVLSAWIQKSLRL